MEEANQVVDLLIHFIELGKGIQTAQKTGPLTFEHKQELRRIRLILSNVDGYVAEPGIKPLYDQLLAIYRNLLPGMNISSQDGFSKDGVGES